MFEQAGKYLNSVRGWVWIASMVGPTVGAFVAGLLEGTPWSHLIMLVTATLASGAVLAYHLLGAYERVSTWWGTRKQGERIARQLEELVAVGHTHMKVKALARMWAGVGASEYERNVCLRRIKQAAEQGLIDRERPTQVALNMETRVALQGCITFFRDRKWLGLPPIPPTTPPAPPKPHSTHQAQRSPFARTVRPNWVTSWRR